MSSMERVEVGYICTKVSGHFSLEGESDHGVCGSHIGARIYIEAEVGGIDLEEQADKLRRWVESAEQALDTLAWGK